MHHNYSKSLVVLLYWTLLRSLGAPRWCLQSTLRPPLCGWIPLRCAVFVLWMRIFFLYRDRSKVYFKEEFSGPSKSQTTIQLDSLVKRGCSDGTKRKCKSGSRLQLDGGGLIDFGICISSRHCHLQPIRVREKSCIALFHMITTYNVHHSPGRCPE